MNLCLSGKQHNHAKGDTRNRKWSDHLKKMPKAAIPLQVLMWHNRSYSRVKKEKEKKPDNQEPAPTDWLVAHLS